MTKPLVKSRFISFVIKKLSTFINELNEEVGVGYV